MYQLRTPSYSRLKLGTYACLLCLSSALSAIAQDAPQRAKGQLLVQLKPLAEVDAVIEIAQRGDYQAFTWEGALAPDWRIHLYSFDETLLSATDALNMLKRSSAVEAVQLNHLTYSRNIPNDAAYFRQWNMDLIKAPDAWNITTGGLTAQGDTIVVAVLEKGYYRSHPDYQSNRWYNKDEVPDNGIDDDLNGYVDDYRGYDPRFDGDGSGNNSNHGTGVSGIVGASGNNSIGVAGVNWNVKMMNICNVDFESEIIDAYYYTYKMRQLYNQSKGAKGAFVVASNASFGIDREKAEDHALWCAVYDSLGTVGVLNVGATSNSNINVDVEGDMPTSCTSPYLITVTNIDQTDKKPSAGYGTQSIDMGAPGSGTVTTGYDGSTATYSVLGGTSSSAPHVSGAIALIYSVPCPDLATKSLSAPIEVLESVRDLILLNLDDNITLSNITKYEGRLNLFKPITKAKAAYCSGVFGALAVTEAFVNQANASISGVLPEKGNYSLRIHNTEGRLMYEKEIVTTIGSFNESLPIDGWMRGVYFATISNGKLKATRKFLHI
jgi:hypothetical protein